MASRTTSRSSTGRACGSSNPFRSENCPGALPSVRNEDRQRRTGRRIFLQAPKNASALHLQRASRAKSNFPPPAAGIVAAPFPCRPGRMFANPLGDIGLRSHHALSDRTVPDELKRFFLAISGICDGTDSQDDFNHSLVLDSECRLAIYARFPAGVSQLRQKSSSLPTARNRRICWRNDAATTRGLLPTGESCPPLRRTIATTGRVGSSITSSARSNSFAAPQQVRATHSIERLTKPPAL